jgi:FkbM family methyltransferase
MLNELLSKSPMLRFNARWLADTLTRDIPWQFEKKPLLRKASLLAPEITTLDVSKRDGILIFHDKGNTLVQRGDAYEPEVQHALMVLIGLDRIRGNRTIFGDIGANIGLHTFYVKSRYKDIPVVAFDPSPSSWQYLDLSVLFNRLSGIQVEKIALSDRSGLIDFYTWGDESSADSLRNTLRVRGRAPKVISVQMSRLDDMAEIPPLTVMKMDCEGAELSALRGARETIRKNRPLLLVEFYKKNREVFHVTTQDIFSFLADMQYSLYSLDFERLDAAAFDACQETTEDSYLLLPDDLCS